MAILVHVLLAAVIAWRLLPDRDVRVSGMVPAPGMTVELLPAEALVPAVFFTSKPDALHAGAAALYKIEDDGSRTLVSEGALHEKRRYGLQFAPVAEPGTYEIVVRDGAEGVVVEPMYFDGEFEGVFPSGNGEPGGVYRAQFQVEHKKNEIMTASLFDETKPVENAETPLSPKPESTQEPQTPETVQKPEPPKPKPEPPKTKPEPPKTKPEPPKPKPEPPKPKPEPPKPKPPKDTPKHPEVAETQAPVPAGEPVTDAPSPVALTPEMLQVSPLNLAPELYAESAKTAERVFAERDTNVWVAASNQSKQRFEAAYNAEGPVIKPGHQGNSVSQHKDVEEYLAAMHNEIHPLWALGFIVRLNTELFIGKSSRMDNMGLVAIVEITLDSLGEVSDVRMVKSSGVTEYDAEAIHVAWNASPGYAPPERMLSKNGKSYIHWTFWRDSRQCGVFGVNVFTLQGSNREALDYSLKAVNVHEKKLGLPPSTLSGDAPDAPELTVPKVTPKSAPSQANPPSASARPDPDSLPEPRDPGPMSEPRDPEPLPAKINPLED